MLGGDARGGCAIHKKVVAWPGWRRIGARDSGGVPCSLFSAPLWPANVLPLLHSRIHLQWPRERDLDLAQFTARQPMQQRLCLDNKHPTGSKTERKLRLYQSQAVDAIEAMGFNALLGDDMGLGKTTVALAAFASSNRERLLVICPAGVKFNWEKEVGAVLGKTRVYLIDGTPKAREGVWRRMDGAGVAIINYDLLRGLKADHRAILDNWVSDQFIVCDESQALKNRKAKRTELSTALVHKAKCRLMLSGTPILDTPEDIFSQLHALRPGTWTSYHNFADRHLIEVPTKFQGRKTFIQVRGCKNLDLLNAVVNTVQIRRLKGEVENLPPKVVTMPELTLDNPTRRIYQAMREYAVLELSKLDEETSIFKPQARSALEAALRCEQIAQGFVGGVPESLMKSISAVLTDHAVSIPGRPGELLFPNSAKLVWIREAMANIKAQGGFPIVMGKFNAPLSWLHQQYQGSRFIHGGVTPKARQDILDAFQDGEVPYLFCQVKCAVGWNGTKSQDVLFLSRDPSPQRNVQAEDRTHRIGTKGTVNIQVPLVRNTIEMPMHKKLLAKAGNAEHVLKTTNVRELREML